LQDNKRHGYSTYTWSDGRRHIGEWFADEEHGRGMLTGVSGYTRTGDWFAGKLKGELIINKTHLYDIPTI